MEFERNEDKGVLRRILKKAKDKTGESLEAPLNAIRRVAATHNLTSQLGPLIERAESSFNDMREIMLRSGVSNMTLMVVFHEIEHGVKLLHKAIENGAPVEQVLPQTRELLGLLDGYSELLRKGGSKRTSLKALATRAIALNRVRLRNHDIQLVADDLDHAEDVFSDLPLGLVLGAITNLIDNSVYWLKAKYPSATFKPGSRAIYIGIDTASYGGPALVIADSGPGFQDQLAELTRPFFSRRPEGIGIGLYYVNLIMELTGGRLVTADRVSSNIPDAFQGAALALVFRQDK